MKTEKPPAAQKTERFTLRVNLNLTPQEYDRLETEARICGRTLAEQTALCLAIDARPRTGWELEPLPLMQQHLAQHVKNFRRLLPKSLNAPSGARELHQWWTDGGCEKFLATNPSAKRIKAADRNFGVIRHGVTWLAFRAKYATAA